MKRLAQSFQECATNFPNFAKKNRFGVQEVTPRPGSSKTHSLSEAAV